MNLYFLRGTQFGASPFTAKTSNPATIVLNPPTGVQVTDVTLLQEPELEKLIHEIREHEETVILMPDDFQNTGHGMTTLQVCFSRMEAHQVHPLRILTLNLSPSDSTNTTMQKLEKLRRAGMPIHAISLSWETSDLTSRLSEWCRINKCPLYKSWVTGDSQLPSHPFLYYISGSYTVPPKGVKRGDAHLASHATLLSAVKAATERENHQTAVAFKPARKGRNAFRPKTR